MRSELEGAPRGRPLRPAPWRGAVRGIALASALALAALASSCEDDADECGDCGDAGPTKVTFTDVDLDVRTAVLYRGFRNEDCAKKQVCVGTPDVLLGDARWQDPEAYCVLEELVAFAPGRRPFPVGSQSGRRVGTGSDIPDFKVTFEQPVEIPVVVFYYAGSSSDETAANREIVVDDIERANRWFDDLGAGVRLTYRVDGDWDLHSVPPTATDDTAAMRAGCDSDGSAAVRGRPAIYRPSGDQGEPAPINVYYPPKLNSGFMGVHCYPTTPGMGTQVTDPRGTQIAYRNVLFVSFELRSEATLAHEIGHALGLVQPLWGHADWLNLYVPFPGQSGNLMNSGNPDVTNVTIGQIYRMHFDRLSWLNLETSLLAGPLKRDCGANVFEPVPCPPINLRAPGWP